MNEVIQNMKIFGRNVRILPTPAIIPSDTREISPGDAPADVSPDAAACPSQFMAISKYPLKKSPTKNVKKKTTPIIPRKIGMLQYLLVSTASTLSVEASLSALFIMTSFIISLIKSYFSLIISDS